MDARGHHSSEIGTGSVPAPSYPNGVEYAPHARRRFCVLGVMTEEAAVNTYQQTIKNALANDYRIGYDPRHVEAFMRLEHRTLDGLSLPAFESEVGIAVQCIDSVGRDVSEQTARSFGL